jgi:hypothetical protein
VDHRSPVGLADLPAGSLGFGRQIQPTTRAALDPLSLMTQYD